MKSTTIYLDHSVVAKDELWTEIRSVLASRDNLRLAISDWNILEIAAGSDRSQGIRRARFLDSVKPLWMLDRLSVAKLEVRDYIWKAEFGCVGPAWLPIVGVASVAMSVVMGPMVPLGLNVEKMVGIWHNDPATLASLLAQRAQGTAALEVLQGISKSEMLRRDEELFAAWIENLMPIRDPSGGFLKRAQKIEMLARCYVDRDNFFRACPTIWVEDEITKARTQNSNRKAKDSDAIDLQHALLALAHCDHFVCRDGFAAQCAEATTKKMQTATVHRSLASLGASLAGSG